MASTKQKSKGYTPGVAEGKVVNGIPTGDDVSVEERVQSLMGVSIDESYTGWGAEILRNDLTLLSTSSQPGSTRFAFTVRPEHCNRLGNLHGGCTATIFDVATTCALAPIARPGFWAYAGVSRTLNVTYIRPVPEGEKVIIETEVVHAGARLSALKGVMKRESDSAVLATCEHGKVSIDPKL